MPVESLEFGEHKFKAIEMERYPNPYSTALLGVSFRRGDTSFKILGVIFL